MKQQRRIHAAGKRHRGPAQRPQLRFQRLLLLGQLLHGCTSLPLLMVYPIMVSSLEVKAHRSRNAATSGFFRSAFTSSSVG